MVSESPRSWRGAVGGHEGWRGPGVNAGETAGANCGIQKDGVAGGGAADSGGGFGFGEEAGGAEGSALPDLHKVAVARDVGGAGKGRVKLPLLGATKNPLPDGRGSFETMNSVT